MSLNWIYFPVGICLRYFEREVEKFFANLLMRFSMLSVASHRLHANSASDTFWPLIHFRDNIHSYARCNSSTVLDAAQKP